MASGLLFKNSCLYSKVMQLHKISQTYRNLQYFPVNHATCLDPSNSKSYPPFQSLRCYGDEKVNPKCDGKPKKKDPCDFGECKCKPINKEVEIPYDNSPVKIHPKSEDWYGPKPKNKLTKDLPSCDKNKKERLKKAGKGKSEACKKADAAKAAKEKLAAKPEKKEKPAVPKKSKCGKDPCKDGPDPKDKGKKDGKK